jgi:predicted nucleic acid-binding protein
MKILLDTNIITGLCEKERREPVVQAIRRSRVHGHELYLVPQVIYEFWVVATRPAAGNGLGLSAADASLKIDGALRAFAFLGECTETYRHWYDLVRKNRVLGKSAHDAKLVAAMRACGFDAIMTSNASHFRRYNVQVIDPRGNEVMKAEKLK